MKISAAIKYENEPAFRVETLTLDDPRPDEVLVKIAGVGLCHTDLVFSSGALPYPFPAVFGHEGAGVVQKVGADVKGFAPGDHVLISFASCGHCSLCDEDLPPYCDTWNERNVIGSRLDGSTALHNDKGDVGSHFFGQSSMADYAITFERNLVKVDKDLPLHLLGPFGCGIQTGAGAVMKSLDLREGRSIVIFGGGPVGLAAVMAAKIRKAGNIVLVEPKASRRDLGTEFGATATFDPTEEGFDERLAEHLPRGAEYVLDCTGVPSAQEAAFACLAKYGTLGFIGVSPPDTKMPGDINAVMSRGQRLIGIIEGDADPAAFIPELIEHYRAGNLPFEKMTTVYPLSQVNQAIMDQHSGACVKAILVPETSEED